MNDLLKNNLFWVVIFITFINISFFVVDKIIVDKISDVVIERLRKNYSPSPYGPGFDPDKINVINYNMSNDSNKQFVVWKRQRGVNL